MQTDAVPPTTLILVKHARPQIIPTLPAQQWLLGEEGRRQCVALADALAPWRPDLIITSEEPKASETAQIVAERLGVPWQAAPGLHEHDRTTVPYFADDAEFKERIKALFARPDELVFGDETASEALTRFTAALDRALAEQRGRSIAVVTHGAVLSLYVAQRFGMDTYTLWWTLDLPAFVVTDAPNLTAPLVVGQVG